MTVAHACDPYHKYMGSHSLQAEPKCTPTEGYKEQTVEGEEDPRQRCDVGQALEAHRLGFIATPLLPGCAALEKVLTSLSLGLSSARRFEWMGFKL